MTDPTTGPSWRSWSGLESAHPRRVARPVDTAAVVAEVERARADSTTVEDGRLRSQLQPPSRSPSTPCWSRRR